MLCTRPLLESAVSARSVLLNVSPYTLRVQAEIEAKLREVDDMLMEQLPSNPARYKVGAHHPRFVRPIVRLFDGMTKWPTDLAIGDIPCTVVPWHSRCPG